MCELGNCEYIGIRHPKYTSKRTLISVNKCIVPLIKILTKYNIHILDAHCGFKEQNGNILIHSDSYRITESGDCEIIIPLKKKKYA